MKKIRKTTTLNLTVFSDTSYRQGLIRERTRSWTYKKEEKTDRRRWYKKKKLLFNDSWVCARPSFKKKYMIFHMVDGCWMKKNFNVRITIGYYQLLIQQLVIELNIFLYYFLPFKWISFIVYLDEINKNKKNLTSFWHVGIKCVPFGFDNKMSKEIYFVSGRIRLLFSMAKYQLYCLMTSFAFFMTAVQIGWIDENTRKTKVFSTLLPIRIIVFLKLKKKKFVVNALAYSLFSW